MPIILIFCILFIIIIGMILINTIKPFIWYEKLNKISEKYMFVIEKYGYLTYSEKNNLLQELQGNGFESKNISITVPNVKKSYGELVNFKINYEMYFENIEFESGKIMIKRVPININVEKYSYSKI